MVIDGAWVTGVFDRVVIERDKTGPRRAARRYSISEQTGWRGMQMWWQCWRGSRRNGQCCTGGWRPVLTESGCGGGLRVPNSCSQRLRQLAIAYAGCRLNSGFTAWRSGPHGAALNNFYQTMGNLKETPPEDEQAQAPEAREVESPQEAHVAEIAALAWRTSCASLDGTRRLHTCGGFLFAQPAACTGHESAGARVILQGHARPAASRWRKTGCALVLSWRRA